jgi:type IV pilus assembly protein PilW
MAGVSLVELMVGITLGLLVLAGLASVFANSSRSRTDIERASRQIENGRYALEVLGDDIRMAGFYGEFNPDVLAHYTPTTPATDVCSTDPVVWTNYLRSPFYGYDNGASVPTCLPGNLKPNTDVMVIRRVAGCEANAGGCPAPVTGLGYFQASKCGGATQLGSPSITDAYRLGQYGTGGTTFDRQIKDCATTSGVRRYMVHVYFIATDNGQGQSIPTLTRLELNPNTPNGFDIVPLVEGIEQLNIEYGIDYNLDGQPDAYSADPSNFSNASCSASVDCTPSKNWENVTAVRLNLLARNIDTTPNYTDAKTYTLGLDASGNPITYTPGDSYQRHAYSSVVRVENVSQRRDLP